MTVQSAFTGAPNYTVSGVGYSPGEILFNQTVATLSPAFTRVPKAGLLCNDSHLNSRMVSGKLFP